MAFTDYHSFQSTVESQIFLAKKASGDSVILKKYQALPRDEILLSNPPKNLLIPLESGKTEASETFPFYRVYPYFSQNLENYLESPWRHPPLTITKKISIAKAITQTLLVAHQRGVLHGNLHPRQIYLNENQEPFLWDFALPPRDWGNLDSTSDQLDDLPHCLDPEQANGQPPTLASDLYSLGAVFYFLLSGRYPFTQDNPLELLHCHLYETPKSLEQYEGPFLFRELVFHLMEKEPSARISLSQVLERLDKIFVVETPVVRQSFEKPNWKTRLIWLFLGLTLFFMLPQVRLFLKEGSLDSLYQTRGKRVKLILKNGETLTGTLIETETGQVQGRLYLRKEEGAVHQFSYDEIQTILDFSYPK